MSSDETAVRLVHLRRFAHWMDDGIKLPGIPLRFGLDPIIGLVPGLGDAAGAIIAAWILVEAARLGASRATLGRIVYNIAVDAVGGTVPLVGDVFDVAWKANLRNVALVERQLADPAGARRADRRFVVLLCGAVLVLCGGLAVVGALLVTALIRLVSGG
jgi:hypothetical protein